MNVLVFFPTYNEAENVRPLIEAIRQELPDAHILVVDDASPDGTGRILDELAQEVGRMAVIHRPSKLGLGSAHKLAMLHARDQKYDALITMDADFSHNPRYLPQFIELLREADFVTGSRYVEGGRCDYGFGRVLISRTANMFAKAALGLRLEENTTMYRGFTRDLLLRLDIEAIRSEGYSFAVESLHRVAQITSRLKEFPIHFQGRAAGASKISKKEIYKAIMTIQKLGFARLLPWRRSTDEETDLLVPCRACGNVYHLKLYPERRGRGKSGIDDLSPYSCATHSSRSHGPILKCLRCGLIFMRPELSAADIVKEYAGAVDPVYLENIDARVATFRYNLGRVRRYFPPGSRVLEIGSYCGAFLKVAREEGIDIVGLEPSSWAASVATQMTDARVICGTTDDLPPELRHFNVIAAWDVLEHFAEPLDELEKVNSLLDPGGLFLFSTLMIDNWFPQAAGRHWPWLMDMHLYYFTENTIRNVLAQAGFEVVESMNYCHIVTLEYLLEKLSTLGVPLATLLSRGVTAAPWAKTEIPFRFGDIKLFVCRKAHDVEPRHARPESLPPQGSNPTFRARQSRAV